MVAGGRRGKDDIKQNTLAPFRYTHCLEMGITWGGGGYFTCSNYFYLPSRRLEEKGGGSAPC